jgi:flotillin
VAQRNAELKERQLDTEVRKPADAARYKVEQEAEAAKNAAILRAEAEKNAAILRAQAQRTATVEAAHADADQARLTGEGDLARRAALAQAVQREGEGEAAAVLARGQAEAEAMRLKAEAFNKYGEAAVLEMLVKMLPEVVEAAAKPMAGIDKMTVISTDGASAVTKNVAATVAQGLQLGTDLTGVDFSALLARIAGGGNTNGSKPDSTDLVPTVDAD